ncbi:MAG TPA: circularly permuted type 2 ATP-grasp protein [Chthoniobacterales bacterium]|nr:circularly permuted type 2 ATP-grasp protein [Chthoniobacterales bacterium]
MAQRSGNRPPKRWHEVLIEPRGEPRPPYEGLVRELERVTSADLRELEERLDATLRELGVTFELPSGNHHNTWFCDLLPQIFTGDEWDKIVRGFEQRVRAFDMFLADVYGKREILRQGVIPIPAVLGSPNFQRSAVGLTPTGGHFLHLSGLCICRDSNGRLLVKNHYLSHASGLSYMIQNRRLLARVLPELFQAQPVESIADIPTEILLKLRAIAPQPDPAVALLTPGVASAVYSEHGFLARRMGIPLVEGGDLVVLDDALFLRTVSGLERVDMVYTRLADPWLDPLVFNRDSRIGIPGLVHCIRKGTLSIVNSLGSQLADDRSLLHFSNAILGFYLGESPILPSIQTYWLGDLDQREIVFTEPDRFQLRALTGESFFTFTGEEKQWSEIRREVLRAPHMFVAQPIEDCAETLCFSQGKKITRRQDHIIYGMRNGTRLDVFPGALTRVSATENGRTESQHGGGGKDTWVVQEITTSASAPEPFRRPKILPTRPVTSRVAEGFYWLGRYLERAMTISKMIQVIETIEMEELTSAERKLYRPVWNRLLPPLEHAGKRGRRSMASLLERYRLMLDRSEMGSVVSIVRTGTSNADSLREAISPEAWAALATLRGAFNRSRFKSEPTDDEARKTTRRLSETVVALIPQFFATAQLSMLADDGWRFSELGQFVERAITTANATRSITLSIARRLDSLHSIEIELSAFLRLLSSRDAYRRIYQTRAEPPQVLEFLWQNAEMPRSVHFALKRCAEILQASLPSTSQPAQQAQSFLEELLRRIRRLDWYTFFLNQDEANIRLLRREELQLQLDLLLSETLELHHVITDNFLSHQSIISDPEPTLF